MKKPIIAITPTEDDGRTFLRTTLTYFTAVELAGGIPVMLALRPGHEDIKQIAEAFDGFLFSGGDDVSPLLYGEEVHGCCGGITPERDRLELALYNEVMALDKPLLGICRGVQMINVAAGGTLYQDLSEFEGNVLRHRQPAQSCFALQHINVEEGSRLAEIIGSTRITANSFHHQAVKVPGEGFRIAARADDGMIEAIENDSKKFCIGVQWHPEALAPTSPEHLRIFETFVESCKG